MRPLILPVMTQMQLKPGDVLNGDFWPEPVRVLTVQVSGPRVKIEAVGLRTQQFFPRILSSDDLSRLQVSVETGRDFTGRAEVFFLAVEGPGGFVQVPSSFFMASERRSSFSVAHRPSEDATRLLHADRCR